MPSFARGLRRGLSEVAGGPSEARAKPPEETLARGGHTPSPWPATWVRDPASCSRDAMADGFMGDL